MKSRQRVLCILRRPNRESLRFQAKETSRGKQIL
jgi:hypothetical protein